MLTVAGDLIVVDVKMWQVLLVEQLTSMLQMVSDVTDGFSETNNIKLM